MRQFIFIFLLNFIFFSTVFAAPVVMNDGSFGPFKIWYSKDNFYAGEIIRIYTFVFNGSTEDIRGSVEFFDSSMSIGKTNFILSVNNRVHEPSIEWKATPGKHTIKARFKDVLSDGVNGKQQVILAKSEIVSSEFFVEIDPTVKAAEIQKQREIQQERINQENNKSKKQETNKQETINNGNTVIGNAVQTVGSVFPDSVKSTAGATVTLFEKLRMTTRDQIGQLQKNKSVEVDAMKDIPHLIDSVSMYIKKDNKSYAVTPNKDIRTQAAVPSFADPLYKLFSQAMLALLSLFTYILSTPIIFYSIMVAIFYYGVGRIIRRYRE